MQAIGPLKSSREFELPSCFTFWDMDDTCINIRDDSIKNPHLLLPIMLYQSVSRNQTFGILTNRKPDESEGCYPVQMFIKDLKSFGINLPKSHVIYGGGINNNNQTNCYNDLHRTLENLTKQLEAIDLTDTAKLIQSGLNHIKESFLADPNSPSQADSHKNGLSFLGSQIERAAYHGKNFHISELLRKHYDIESRGFRFEGTFFPEHELLIGIVDDKSEIAGQDVIASLGKQYFGIKASDGGKPPVEISTKGDYYQDQYLFVLAKKIGLDQLATVIDQNIDVVLEPRLHFAGLLYAWQRNHDNCNLDEIVNSLNRLTSKQCDQTVAMLVAIDKFANRHLDANYNNIEKILSIADSIANEKFLNCAHDKILKVRSLIQIEKTNISLRFIQNSPLDSNLKCLEKKSDNKKSKFSFGFGKNSSKLKPDSLVEFKPEATLEIQSVQLNRLLAKEKKLVERLNALKDSPRSCFSKLAHQIDEGIHGQSCFIKEPSYLPSRNDSSTVNRKTNYESKTRNVISTSVQAEIESESDDAIVQVTFKSNTKK